MATSKQDRQGSRTVSDLESKFGQRFLRFLGLIDDTRDHVDSVESKLNQKILEQSTTLKRDAEKIVAEAVKKCATKDDVEEISAQIKLEAGRLSIRAEDDNGTLTTIINCDGSWQSEYTDKEGNVCSGIYFDFAKKRFVFDGDVAVEDLTGETLSGKKIMANFGGEIAGWTIDDNSMRIGSLGEENSMWLCNTGTKTKADIGNGSGNGWCLAIGNKFGVKKGGQLFGKDVDLTGTICATSGQIGGWYIEEDCLSSTLDYLTESGVRLFADRLAYNDVESKSEITISWKELIQRVHSLK